MTHRGANGVPPLLQEGRGFAGWRGPFAPRFSGNASGQHAAEPGRVARLVERLAGDRARPPRALAERVLELGGARLEGLVAIGRGAEARLDPLDELLLR